MRRSIAAPGRAVLLGLALTLPGCSTITGWFGGARPPEGAPGYVRGFLGAVAADEPQAALAGRKVLAAGGNAVDAAVAMGFVLTVTLPSRAGLGSGGACLALNGDRNAPGVPEAFVFLPTPPANPAGADRPASPPMLARGLFLMHARQGKARFETLVQPAEQMAREGAPVSRAFARDLAVVGSALASDQPARLAYFPNGRPPAEGEVLTQADLGGTLAQLGRVGVGDLYSGTLAQRLVAGASGSGLTAADLRAALPRQMPPLLLPVSSEGDASFLPLPADGGLAAAAAFQALLSNPADLAAAQARGAAAAAQFRSTGADAKTILAKPSGGALPALPASTTFATLDPAGNAVVCAISMGNLFGTGRVVPGTGMLLAASPAWMPPPLYAAGMLSSRRYSALRALAGGSGQEGAAIAVAKALADSLADTGRTARINPTGAPEPGRANIIACNAPPADSPQSCGWSSDPRGFGLATGSN